VPASEEKVEEGEHILSCDDTMVCTANARRRDEHTAHGPTPCILILSEEF